jgi:hypothetical protein
MFWAWQGHDILRGNVTSAYPKQNLDLVVVDLGLQGHHFLQARASYGSA